MGTHPIFESDFDCLTEIEYEKGQKMRINWVKCKMKMDK